MAKLLLRLSFVAIILGFGSICIAQKKLKTIIIDAGHGYKGANKTSPDGAPGRLCNEDDVALAVALKLEALINKKYPDLTTVQTRPDDDFITLGTRSKIANENKGDLFICIHVNDADTHREKVLDSFKVVTKYRNEKDSLGKTIKVPYEDQVAVYKWQRVGCSAFGAQSYVMVARNSGAKQNAAKKGLEEDSDTSLQKISSIQAALNVKKYFQKSVMMSQLVQAEFKAINRKFGSGDAIYQRPKGIHVLEATNMPSLLIETGFICNDRDEKYLCSNAGQQELAECIMRAFINYRVKVDKPDANVKNNQAASKVEPVLPATVRNRKNEFIETINIDAEKVTLNVYDDGDIDGDIVSIYLNGKLLINKETLSNDPITINLKKADLLNTNELVMVAETLGTVPPNTAAIILYVGQKRYEVSLKSDVQKNAGIKFVK